MEIFLDLFGAQNIACLLGDREFVGSEWFRFLKRHRIKFQMRLHRDTLVRNGRGQYVQAWRLFCRTRINCPLVIPEARRMWGMELYLSGCRLKNGEYLILVSPEFCEKPHEQYRKRWGIETLFAALKSRGFNLEDTHIARPGTLEPIACVTGVGLHLGLCRWPLASECQRTETEETWLSAQEHLPSWTQYLVPFSDQPRTLRSCCLAEGY